MKKSSKPARWCNVCGCLTDHHTGSHDFVTQKQAAAEKHVHDWYETAKGNMRCSLCLVYDDNPPAF